MASSSNLGIGMEGNGGGAYTKQEENSSLNSIVFTSLVLEKENICTIYPRRRMRSLPYKL